MPEPVTPTTEPAATPAVPAPAAAAPTTVPVKWEDLFKDEDPARVKEALENSRKWEARSKENKAALDAVAPDIARLKALEEASKTDQQRLEDAATAAKTELATAKSEAARLRVAVKHGLAEEDFDLLGNGSEDELNARAERIAAMKAAASGQRTPAPNPAQGTSGHGAPDLETQIAAAVAAGDVALQVRLQNQKLLDPLKR